MGVRRSSHLVPGLDRRRFLHVVGTSTALLVTGCARLVRAAALGASPRRWSDPATWGGRAPGPNDEAVVDGHVLLDVDAHVAAVRVAASGILTFEPRRSRVLASRGNVTVAGRLEMRPASPEVLHRLVFSEVEEAGFVGGGESPIPSDVGLWVIGGGVLDIAGSPKLAWTRAAGSLPAGGTTIELQKDPVGWRPGDELVITPTLPPTTVLHASAFDVVTVAAVSGRTVHLMRPTRTAHPAVAIGRGITVGAEVLNVTRNVRIHGMRGARAHVFVGSSRSQSIRHALVRYMGPRQHDYTDGAGRSVTKGVTGRYGLHFHQAGDGSRGSLVEGVVVRDCGNHAFVPHGSHGITFRHCVSHDTFEDAYWWDMPNEQGRPPPETHDNVYDGCVASLVHCDPPSEGVNLAGFAMLAGTGNAARHCVAVGVQGTVNANGFKWPDGSEGIWTFEDCVSHNNAVHGLWVWQVTSNIHRIDRFISYHNGRLGISNGSYANNYQYRDSVLYGNAGAQMLLWGVSAGELIVDGLLLDGAGIADHAMVLAGRAIPPGAHERELAGIVRGCTMRGYRHRAVMITFEFHDFGPNPTTWRLEDNAFGPGTRRDDFWLADDIHASTRVLVEDTAHGTLTLRRSDQEGMDRPAWNARSSTA